MQGSWLGIGLMAVVVVACSIAGLTQSRTKVQMKATLCAVVTLILVIGLFCYVVIASSWGWAAPLFAAAAAIAPFAVYCAAMVAWENAERSVQPASREPLRRVSAAAKPKAFSGRMVSAAPIAIERASSDRVGQPSVFLPIEMGSRSIENEECREEVEVEVEEAMSVARAPVKVHEPAAEAAPSPEPEPEPEPMPVQKPVSQPAAAPPAPFDAARYFERAAALRDKGLHLAASRLYAECAELADDRSTSRKASLEEIACYVRAGSLEHARKLAEELLASAQDLTPVEKIKLDAVLKAA